MCIQDPRQQLVKGMSLAVPEGEKNGDILDFQPRGGPRPYLSPSQHRPMDQSTEKKRCQESFPGAWRSSSSPIAPLAIDQVDVEMVYRQH